MCPTVQQFKNTVAAKLSALYCIDHYRRIAFAVIYIKSLAFLKLYNI